MDGILSGLERWAMDVLLTLGYLGIAVLVALETIIPPIPSELILPLAGFHVAEGRFSYPVVVLSATVGSLLGSFLLYGLGVWFGQERLRHFVSRAGRYIFVDLSDLDRSERWFDQHGRAAVFAARLVPGMRSLISLPAGLAHMPLWSFAIYTLLGSVVWNGLLVGLGWLLGSRWELVGTYGPIIEYAVLALVLAMALRFFWRRRRLWRAAPRRAGRAQNHAERFPAPSQCRDGDAGHAHDVTPTPVLSTTPNCLPDGPMAPCGNRAGLQMGRDSITNRVIGDAQRMFGDRADAATLEQYARDAIAELWSDTIKIRDFTTVLALRKVREALESQERAESVTAETVGSFTHAG
jgi:membrane protein DedA with SNARE-associated domain